MTLALVTTQKVHAKFSPSKAHRWLPCPGSIHLDDDPPTMWAAEGTKKHAVLEIVLSADMAIAATGGTTIVAGDTIDTEAGDYVVPLEVLEQCYEVKEYIEQYHQTHKDGWVVETETRVEVGIHYWPNMEKGECAGTCDAVAYAYDEMLVLDAKFGFVRVEPKGNPQLLLYAAGLLAEVPFPIKFVTLCIAQPDYDGTMQFREHRMTAAEVHEWMFQQQHIVEEIKSGSRRLHADDKACLWCPARVQCPERLKAMELAVQEDWATSHTLEELLPYVPRLRAIAKDIEARAMAELGRGETVRGWKVVAAKSKRVWPPDMDGQAVLLAADVGIEGGVPADFYDMKLKSPAKMEKVVRAIKKMPVKEAKEIVNKYALTPTGGPKLVPESDPRPALEPATWTLEDALNASLSMMEAPDGE